MSMITAEEFLAGYAGRSGSTPEGLLAEGRVVATCRCDYDACEGWQLTRPEHMLPWKEEKVVITDQAEGVGHE